VESCPSENEVWALPAPTDARPCSVRRVDLSERPSGIARMKKANSSTRGSAAKGNAAPTPKTVEDYLAAVPEPARSTLQRVRAAIHSVVPAEATEAISYGMPAFKYKGTLVWFAAFSNHCSLFPTASVIKAFKNELKGYETTKGTVHFPLDKPLPAALVKKMVKARLAEKTQKKQR
jgi:uncharacterized protein YdhG (YjbR/CyaY superfamily)